MGDRSNVNAVFYAESYHPIQAGSIDGTDILPHDNAIYRALLCSSAGLYDPHGDPKVVGDPYCTLFVGHLSHLTNEETLKKAMSRHGRVKNLRLVRHIVTGASRGYAFVEYETEREMMRAYQDAHHSFIDDSEIIVDYNRQQLMPGWIPRRLGGGLGGRKESGQLRFGGRERPFRAPLRPIPYDDLKRLGIPAPPEGNYMSRFQAPSPPRRTTFMDVEDLSSERRRRTADRDESPRHRKNSDDEESIWRKRRSSADQGYLPAETRRTKDREESPRHTRKSDSGESSWRRKQRGSDDQRDMPVERIRRTKDEYPRHRRKSDDGESSRRKRSSDDRGHHSSKHSRHHHDEHFT